MPAKEEMNSGVGAKMNEVNEVNEVNEKEDAIQGTDDAAADINVTENVNNDTDGNHNNDILMNEEPDASPINRTDKNARRKQGKKKSVLNERKKAKTDPDQKMMMENWMRNEWKAGTKSLSREEKIRRRASSDDQEQIEQIEIDADVQKLIDSPIVKQVILEAAHSASKTAFKEAKEMTADISEHISDMIRPLENEIEELKLSTEYRDGEIQSLQEINEGLTDKISELEGRLLRAEKQITDLKEENTELKSRGMENNLIFKNIEEKTDGREECKKVIETFAIDKLKLRAEDIQIDRAHRMGQKVDQRSRPIIVKCANNSTKQAIMRNAKNLKNTKYGINEQVPREYNERRNQLMTTYKVAKDQGKKVRWNRDKLIVEGKLHAPINDDELYARSNAVICRQEENFQSSQVIEEKGSQFQAHIIKINSSEQVIPSLHKLFRNHNIAKASHNSYAYRINEVSQNSNDDGEYGAGNKILKLLEEQNRTNVLVVVTRWYGGSKLGEKRFVNIAKVTNDVLKM